MTQSLTLFINLFAYSDGVPTNNPQLRDFDYARRIDNTPTSKTRSQQYIIPIADTQSIMSLNRALTTGASWTISNPTGVTSRFTWSGTNPVLRTERTGSVLSTSDTVIVNRQAQSQVVRLTFSASPGSSIAAGDELYIGPDVGLNPLNQGYFTVVGVSGLNVDVLSASMVNETVTLLVPSDIYFYSSGPVRVGDFLLVKDTAFNFGNRGEFQITAVTSRFVEVQNTDLVPEGPVTADVVAYDQIYRLMYLETDQVVNVYINGSVVPIQVEPIQEGQPGMVGIFLSRTPVYSVSIQNLGFNAANVTSFFAT